MSHDKDQRVYGFSKTGHSRVSQAVRYVEKLRGGVGDQGMPSVRSSNPVTVKVTELPGTDIDLDPLYHVGVFTHWSDSEEDWEDSEEKCYIFQESFEDLVVGTRYPGQVVDNHDHGAVVVMVSVGGESGPPPFYSALLRDDTDIKTVLTLSSGSYYFMSDPGSSAEWATRVSETIYLPVNTTGSDPVVYVLWWRYSWADANPTAALTGSLPPRLGPEDMGEVISTGAVGADDPYLVTTFSNSERWLSHAPGLGLSYSMIYGHGFQRMALAPHEDGVRGIALMLAVPEGYLNRYRYLPYAPNTGSESDCLTAVRVTDMEQGTAPP